MTKFNAKNERMKYNYKVYLSNAKQRDNKTVTSVLKHVKEFEKANELANFIHLNEHIIHSYIEGLLARNLSLSFIDGNLRALREFYSWLGMQKGYKKINYNLFAYFSLTHNQRKTAKAPEYQDSYELDDIFSTISLMPEKTLEQRRNKAMIALDTLCALRISELRTIKLGNIRFDRASQRYLAYISPKNMSTKFAKSRSAYFMPFKEALEMDLEKYVINWKEELKTYGFGDDDPLFPKITPEFNQNNLLEPKIKKEVLASNTSIREVFKKAFINAGYEYIHPHTFRHTIARWAENYSPKFFNAVSQSLGHSDIKTTLTSYGALAPQAIGRSFSEEFQRVRQ